MSFLIPKAELENVFLWNHNMRNLDIKETVWTFRIDDKPTVYKLAHNLDTPRSDMPWALIRQYKGVEVQSHITLINKTMECTSSYPNLKGTIEAVEVYPQLHSYEIKPENDTLKELKQMNQHLSELKDLMIELTAKLSWNQDVQKQTAPQDNDGSL